jgi:hypothetical protein
MKLAKSANPKAETLNPGHRKNRSPRNTGQKFERSKTGQVDGERMRMDSIHRSKAGKGIGEETMFRVIPP